MDKIINTNQEVEDDDISPAARPPKLTVNSVLICDLTQFEFIYKLLNESGYNNFKLELLYRATNDGDENFHNICDGINNTVMVIKAKETGLIFGGYTKNAWSKNEAYQTDDKAFLFSLTHLTKIPIKDACWSIYTTKSAFEIVWGYPDDIKLYPKFMTSKMNKSALGAYKNNDITDKNFLSGIENFQVEELELFRIINN